MQQIVPHSIFDMPYSKYRKNMFDNVKASKKKNEKLTKNTQQLSTMLGSLTEN